jgi:Flp pilus assembly protein TadG
MRTQVPIPIRAREERGSVSAWVVIFAGIALVLLWLVVDGGQVMVAKSRAADIAEQAARAAADYGIDIPALRNGNGTVRIDQGPACTAAAALVSSYSNGQATLTGCPAIGADPQGAPTVTVQVRMSVTAAIPSPVFPDTNVTGSGTAYLACGSATAKAAC